MNRSVIRLLPVLMVASAAHAQHLPPDPWDQRNATGLISHDDFLLATQTERPAVPPPPGGLVSVAELRHKIPAKARKELELFLKAWDKQRLNDCANHLSKAIEFDPENLPARKMLGAVYIKLNDAEKVKSAYEGVLALDPRSAEAYSFIGMADISMHRFSDAEIAGRRALDIDPQNPRGRFLLGASLSVQDKNEVEALKLLNATCRQFPVARIFAAHSLARLGRTSDAREQLEAYMPIAPAADREQIESWLKLLAK